MHVSVTSGRIGRAVPMVRRFMTPGVERREWHLQSTRWTGPIKDLDSKRSQCGRLEGRHPSHEEPYQVNGGPHLLGRTMTDAARFSRLRVTALCNRAY